MQIIGGAEKIVFELSKAQRKKPLEDCVNRLDIFTEVEIKKPELLVPLRDSLLVALFKKKK